MTTGLCLALALLGQSQVASSPFSGTWVIDTSSIEGSVPERYALRHGRFSRGNVGNAFTVAADGHFHAMPSDGYVDAVAVTVRGLRAARERDRFKGRLAYTVDYAVSANGNTLTKQVVDFSKPDREPIPTTITYRRIGRAERTGSRVSGRWTTVAVTTTRAHLSETLTLDGTRLRSSGPGGTGYDAVIGGPPVVMEGDAAGARISITMPDDRTVVERMSQNGSPMVLVTMTLLPDDRTIKVVARRERDGNVSEWLLHKQ